MFAIDTEAKTPFSSQVTLHLKYLSLWSLLHCINFKRRISATSRPWRIWTQRCWPHISPWMTTSSCIPLRWIRSPLALTLCQPWAPCSSPYPPLHLQPLPPAVQWCRSLPSRAPSPLHLLQEVCNAPVSPFSGTRDVSPARSPIPQSSNQLNNRYISHWHDFLLPISVRSIL